MPRNKALSSKNYVLDTNILLHEPLAFLSFKENDVVVPMTVLEELDYIKDSKKDVARDARVSIRAMEDLLHAEDYRTEQMVTDIKYLSKGYHQFDGDIWDAVKSVDSCTQGRYTIHSIERKLLPEAYVNEFLLNESQHFAGIVESVNNEHLDVLDLGYERLMGRREWGVTPKNIINNLSFTGQINISSNANSGKCYV
jgi:predicted ribonuclease YlaK|tara:strand:+ start:397 stop:987 length:591 start_codon:yes stop_codon:yes gene_type:complete